MVSITENVPKLPYFTVKESRSTKMAQHLPKSWQTEVWISAVQQTFCEDRNVFRFNQHGKQLPHEAIEHLKW